MTRGLARAGFDKDLLFGQAREDAFVRTLMGRTFLEHKSDQRARETGNFFIEFETSAQRDGFGAKKPSGLSVCDAELWVTEFHDDCWVVVPTDYIRMLVEIAQRQGKTVWGGDYNRFHGALIPWRWLLHPPSIDAGTNGTGPHGEQLTL